MKATCKFDFGVARLPYYPDVPGAPQNSIIGGASLWVMGKEEPGGVQGRGQVLHLPLQPEIQAFWHQQTGYLPITRAAYELTKSQGYYKENPGPELAIQQLQNKPPTANSDGHPLRLLPQIREIVDEEWEDILADKKSPRSRAWTTWSGGATRSFASSRRVNK